MEEDTEDIKKDKEEYREQVKEVKKGNVRRDDKQANRARKD